MERSILSDRLTTRADRVASDCNLGAIGGITLFQGSGSAAATENQRRFRIPSQSDTGHWGQETEGSEKSRNGRIRLRVFDNMASLASSQSEVIERLHIDA